MSTLDNTVRIILNSKNKLPEYLVVEYDGKCSAYKIDKNNMSDNKDVPFGLLPLKTYDLNNLTPKEGEDKHDG